MVDYVTKNMMDIIILDLFSINLNFNLLKNYET